MAKPLDLSKSTKSDWIEGASMTEMQLYNFDLYIWRRAYTVAWFIANR